MYAFRTTNSNNNHYRFRRFVGRAGDRDDARAVNNALWLYSGGYTMMYSVTWRRK